MNSATQYQRNLISYILEIFVNYPDFAEIATQSYITSAMFL